MSIIHTAASRRGLLGLTALAGVGAIAPAATAATAAGCGPAAGRDEARRLAAGFVDFLTAPKLEHKALFSTPMDMWRTHFPDNVPGVRKIDMGPFVDGKVAAKGKPAPKVEKVRTHVHEDGNGFTLMWEQGGVPICMVCTVGGGKIVRFDEYIDAHYEKR